MSTTNKLEPNLKFRTEELKKHFLQKYGQPAKTGWCPRIRFSFGYFTPSDYYEAYLARLLTAQTNWLDVGCGRSLCSSDRIAALLSSRCRLLVGVDPDDTINENLFVHEKVKGSLHEYRTDRRFDLVTLNMVAEHITDPSRTIEDLARLTVSGAKVVVFTVFKWSPVPIATRFIPFRLHHWFKSLLWRTKEKDTFPVAYKMNTRRALGRLFCEREFSESCFAYLDDCRTFQSFKALLYAELCVQRVLRMAKLHYPEVCILAVYERR